MDNKFNREEIIKQLNSKGVKGSCSRCGSKSFTIIDGFSYLPVQDTYGNVTLGGVNVPIILTACSNCGAITQHALGALQKLNEQKEGKS